VSALRFSDYAFGTVTIDGVRYEHDVVVDRGKVRKRSKKPSKAFQHRYGHTPLSAREDIPWRCRTLLVGTGAAGSLPVMSEVVEEAAKHSVELVTMPTAEAIEVLNRGPADTNAILHVTC
jgi:hypothetical protein